MPGYFITFEGIDGSGKSTHAERLAEALRADGHDVVLTLEPGGTDLGRAVRELVLNSPYAVPDRAELLLFAADRAAHVETLIRPAIEAGKIVVSDRFADSTRAYQGFGRGIDRTLIETAIDAATGGLVPDVTIMVDVDVPTSRTRTGGGDRLESDSDGFFEAVREGFLALHAEDPDRILLFDGTEPVDAVAAAILRAIRERLA